MSYGPDLQRSGCRVQFDRGFTYESWSPRPATLPPEPLRHAPARPAHLRNVSTSPNLQDGLPTLLTIHDIAALFRVQRTTAYARTREPDFPDPLVISGSCYRWYSHEVLAYIDSRRSEKRVYLRRDPLPEARDPLAVSVPSPRARTTRCQRRYDSPPSAT